MSVKFNNLEFKQFVMKLFSHLQRGELSRERLLHSSQPPAERDMI